MHVAAVAQLVREERKRLEQIHPKACCPTCLYTHTHTYTRCCVFICLSLAVLGVQHCLFCLGNRVISLWETLSAALDDIRHIHHKLYLSVSFTDNRLVSRGFASLRAGTGHELCF